MSTRGKDIPIANKREILAKCGYKCINPVCSHYYPANTLNIHHIHPDGDNNVDNLSVLCEQCHSDTHSTGKYSSQTIRGWKTQISRMECSGITFEAQAALKFDIPNYIRAKDKSSRIAKLCKLLLRSDRSATPTLVVYLLRFELAKALHRIGASVHAAAIMDDLLDTQEKSNDLSNQGFGETNMFLLRHARARESIQLGSDSLATRQLETLSSIAEEIGIYGRGNQATQYHLETLAQVNTDLLHAATLYNIDNIESVVDNASRSVYQLAGRSKKAVSILSQYNLYRGIVYSQAGKFGKAEKYVIDSLNSKADQSKRGRSIRLSMLGAIYLRDYINCQNSPRRQLRSLSKAAETFRRAIDIIQFPQESYANIFSLWGLSLSLRYSGIQEESLRCAERASYVAEFIGLSSNKIYDRLVAFIKSH